MKITYKVVILALAAICLMIVPGFSSPWDRGSAGIHHGGWLLLADDITEEELDSMTLAEIRELREQKMQELDSMTLAELKEQRSQMGRAFHGANLRCGLWFSG